MWEVEFTTDRFLPLLPEDCQANPGVYGFELAYWLAIELQKKGITTSYPLGEDWGWFIEYLQDDVELMICCGSQADGGEGYLGKPIQWRVFVRSAGGLFKKRKGPEVESATARITRAIGSCLVEAGIDDARVDAASGR